MFGCLWKTCFVGLVNLPTNGLNGCKIKLGKTNEADPCGTGKSSQRVGRVDAKSESGALCANGEP
jgi:hypothetical protein